MPTWLPMWKAKSCYHIDTFLPTWFFLPLQKFKTIKIKLEKNTYTQANMCLLHISRNFKDIFKSICFTLYLSQTVNNWESAIVFVDCCCLPCFFISIDIRSNQFRVDLTSVLASNARHYCSVLNKNSLSKMPISGNIFYVFEHTNLFHLLNEWYLKRIYSRELTLANCVSKIANFTEGILWIKNGNLISQKIFSLLKTKG